MAWYDNFKDINWSLQNVSSLFDLSILPFNIVRGSSLDSHYINIKKRFLNTDKLDKPIIVQQLALSDSNLRDLIFFLNNFIDNHTSNYLKGELASNSIAIVLTNLSKGITPIGVVGGSLWNFISNEVNSKVIPIIILKSLVTQGGKYITRIQITKGNGKDLSLIYCEVCYTIQVGNETGKRYFPLITFIMPFIVQIDLFITKGQFNNKKIQRIDNIEFAQIDVDNGNNEGILKFIEQDKDYYYFHSQTKNEDYRISIWGGSWDKFYTIENKWKTFYLKTISE